MSKIHKKPRQMEFFIMYLPETNSWFINKSKTPKQSVRRQFHRAYHEDRPDYDTEFYQDIRNHGVESFVVRYCLELPDFCEGKRAHYVKNNEPNANIYMEILKMREEPLTVDEIKELRCQERNEKK